MNESNPLHFLGIPNSISTIIITIFDILNQAAVSDSAYFHFKEILKNNYDEINKEKMTENESEFVKKYDAIVESHKFIHSKSSIEIPIQSKKQDLLFCRNKKR